MGRARTPLGTHGKIFVSKTKAGTWQAITYYRGMDGRRRKLHFTARTKAAAERGLREYAAQITQTAGKTLSPHSTVAQAVELWWEEWSAEKERSYNTQASYQQSMNKHILPGVGSLQLIECTTGVLSSFFNRIAQTSGAATAVRARTVLKMAFDTAARYDAIPKNPVDATRRPQSLKKSIEVLSIDDIENLRKILPERERLAFELMLATGARIGEILAIRWEDVETTPAGTIVHLAGTIVGVGKETRRQEHRKSGNGISLYLPDFAVHALDSYVPPGGRRRGVIFVGSEKSNWLVPGNTLRGRWKKALHGTGYEYVHPHMVRATVATLLANNTDVAAASAQLGNTEAVLRKHYWKRDALAPDARAILSAFGG